MRARGDRDDARTFPLCELQREVPHAARGAIDEHRRLGVQCHRAMLCRLKRRRMIVSELDQELPRGQP